MAEHGHRAIIFKINDKELCIDINKVDSIIPPMDIYKIPDVPDFIEGLINLRGKIYTVFNLRKRFKMPSHEFNEGTKILLVKMGSAVEGIIADEVREIIKVEDETIEEFSQEQADIEKKYFIGSIRHNDRTIHLLDLAYALSPSEY